MNTDGKKLIASLCRRLNDEGELCTDNNILTLLRTLDRYEVNQLVTFGTIDKWVRDKNSKKRESAQ